MSHKTADCIRQVANWSSILPAHKFDKKSFSAKEVESAMATASPKMEALFKKIEELDERDMKREGKTFKHMIFSDVKSMGYGAKILMAGFLAKGFHAAYDNKFTINEEELKKHKGNNVALLCSTAVHDKPIGVRFRKSLLSLFNQRPENIYGELIRFIILDQGFKEGIDLFDVKYVHLFEPLITKADEKQAIGRGTRFCGQKGLHFHPTRGWPLHVIRYDVRIPNELQSHFGADTLSELYLQKSGVDMRSLYLANELEKVVADAAVDAELTEEIHHFSIDLRSPKDSQDMQGGGRKKKRALYPKAPRTKKTHKQMREYVRERFMKYKWPEATLENMCGYAGKGGEPNNVEFTPTQEFVRHYFTPQIPYKGMLLFHGVGVGKTCSAIATATTAWEPRGYSILWVTRHTLKADIWKNMFQQVCSLVLKGKLKRGEITIPEKAMQTPMKYVSKYWLPPISFKQFSNLCLGKNDLYKLLVKKNGEKDPLRKTLIILDEAHKLFATDVTGQERPNPDAIKKALETSFEVSGKDSARVLMMSATPFTSNPMDMMKLLNMMREPSEQLPEDMESFVAKYLDEDGRFTPEGKDTFMDDIAGTISYLNREKDARQFAYPVFSSVMVDMTQSTTIASKKEIDDIKMKLAETKANVKEGDASLKAAKKKAKAEAKEAKAKCKDLPRAQQKSCKDAIDTQFKHFEDNLLAELSEKLSRDKSNVDAMKLRQKELKDNISNSTDTSQEYAVNSRCFKKK